MKTLPARPANIPAPPEGYVFLGHRRDIKVPESWNENSRKSTCAFASFHAKVSTRWDEWPNQSAEADWNGYLAAKPNTPLYNLNKDLLPMNTPATTVKTLKYKIVTRQNGLVAVQITEQSHRNGEFGENGSCRFGKLGSSSFPNKETSYWVRGAEKGQDDHPLLLTELQFTEFEKEVAAYNAHFAKPTILKTVFFEYSAGSVRGYRRVEVVKEDSTYLEGIDSKKGEYRKFLKSKIVGNVDTVKA